MTTPNITRLKLPAIRQAVSATLWAIQREKLMAMLEVVEVRSIGGSFTPGQVAARTGEGTSARSGGRTSTKSGGSIAVIPLYGVISQRMDMFMAISGGTSTERFADEFDAAMADNSVSAIVIDCDSPGGNVQGTPELAKRIFDARGKGKKIYAVCNGTMASAAYWISSAADEVICTTSGEVGSIGVFMVHLDESGLNEQLGLSYTMISAGEFKTEGNPFQPLSDAARAHFQEGVDEMYGMFVGAVAKHRGVSTKVVQNSFGQGRVFSAKQALSAGMIDKIATLEETLRRLGATDVGLSGRPRGARAEGMSPMEHMAVDRGKVVRMSASGDVEPDPTDEPTGDPTQDDEGEPCPECSKPMKGKTCEACGYRADDSDDSDDEAGASASSNANSPDNRPDEAKESTVHNNSTTAGGAGPEINAAVVAERERCSAIRKLGKTHKVSDEVIEACISEGLSQDQAATRILGQVEARGGVHATSIQVGSDREADRPFAHAGEQMMAIVRASRHGVRDVRLARVNANALRIGGSEARDMMAGSPSGMNEGVASEGGFFLAPEVLPGVIEPVYTEDPILSRVTRIPIGNGTNRTVYNVVDESSRVDGSRWGGIQMFWGDEADTAAGKKPKLRQVEQLLKKLIGIGYLTDEQLEDTPQAQTLMTTAFQAELQFMLASGIFRGPGGGQMLGFLKGKGFVQQAIEPAQTIANTATSIGMNVTKMLANIPAALWDDVIFLYNQDLLPYLVNATIGANGTVPLFIGAGGLVGKPFDTILGKPAFASEQCEAVGTPGDIIAIAPSQYHIGEKGGAYIATSIHVRFLNDETALRITYRVDGKPVWNTTVAPYKGANARGFASTLAVRV